MLRMVHPAPALAQHKLIKVNNCISTTTHTQLLDNCDSSQQTPIIQQVPAVSQPAAIPEPDRSARLQLHNGARGEEAASGECPPTELSLGSPKG
jgi:hypothetical protein